MPTSLEIKDRFPQVGRVEWIGVAGEKRGAIEPRDAVEITVDEGIVGEHHLGGHDKKRQVTLIQSEHLAVIGALAGINVYGLRDRRFRIGDVTFEGTGTCPPCGRIEENLGEGGYQAARGHAGITARVVAGGSLRIGDTVRVEGAERDA